MNIKGLTYQTHALIGAPKFDTSILWSMSGIFVVLTLIYLGFIFFLRNRVSSKLNKTRLRKNEMAPIISEFLFYEDDASKDEKSNYVALKIDIRELLKDDFNRKLLSEVLLDLRKDVSGDTRTRLFNLYQYLGLHQDAYTYLKSWRWELVSKGILELTQMEVAESYSFITEFINHKGSTIRKQAEIAVVTLKNEGINYFLDTTKYKISEWQQLKLLDVLRHKENFQPPKFKAWLTSNNKYVVLFSLRLIKYYNQNDTRASLIELVKHRNDQIKEEAISCIKDFNIVEALDTLKLVFWKSSVTIKLSILDAIGVLGTDTDIEFLKLIDKKESNFLVKSKAIGSINAIAPESVMPSKGIQDTNGYQIPDDIVKKPKKKSNDITDYSIEDQDALAEYVDKPLVDNEVFEKTIEEVFQSDVEAIIETSDQTIISQETGVEESNTIEEIEDEPTDIDHTTSTTVNVPDDSMDEGIDLSFLPFIIEENTAFDLSDTEAKESFETKPIHDLNELNVIFETVIPEITDEPSDTVTETNQEQLTINSLDGLEGFELRFLPIVTDDVNEEKEPIVETQKLLRNIDVIYEEISSATVNKKIEDAQWLNFSPTLSEDGIVASGPKPSRGKKVDLNETQIESFKKELDNIVGERYIAWPLEEKIKEDEIFALNFMPSKSNEELDKTTQNIKVETDITLVEEDKNNAFEIVLNTELLDDIDEYGDMREIPLLQELLKKTDKKGFKTRIQSSIEKFSKELHTEIVDTPKIDTAQGSKTFSVFEDLFNTVSDIECQLVLLNEITAVGDEKEIDFLNTLLEHPEGQIRKKAKEVLHELEKILAQRIENGVSEVTFEISGDRIKNVQYIENEQPQEDSFFDQLRSISSKIIGKFNG